jgi:hypothetical protein
MKKVLKNLNGLRIIKSMRWNWIGFWLLSWMVFASLGRAGEGGILLRYRFKPDQRLTYVSNSEESVAGTLNNLHDSAERRNFGRDVLEVIDTTDAFRLALRADSTWSHGKSLFASNPLARQIQNLDSIPPPETFWLDSRGDAASGNSSLACFLTPLPADPVDIGDSWDFEIRRLVGPVKGTAAVQGQGVVIGMESKPRRVVQILVNLETRIEQQGDLPSDEGETVFSKTTIEYETRLDVFDVDRGLIIETDSDATREEKIESVRFAWKASISSKTTCRLVEP